METRFRLTLPILACHARLPCHRKRDRTIAFSVAASDILKEPMPSAKSISRNHAASPVACANTDISAKQLRALYQQLLTVYGPQHWWPSLTPFETILGAYLVQNTSWRGVVRSIANLESRNALTPAGLRALSIEELRILIRPSGYMIRKSAALLAFLHLLDGQYAGSLDQLAAQQTAPLRLQLLALPGVGPETADVILLYALGHPVMVVDEYLRRIASRHHLAPAKAGYRDLQQLALAAFAGDEATTLLAHFNEFHALVVEAGKNHCGPTPRCAGCPLEPMLPSANERDRDALVRIQAP